MIQDNSLRGEFAGSLESDDLDGRSFELRLSKRPTTKRLSDVFGQRDQILSNDIAGGTDVDDLFADWSADPRLQPAGGLHLKIRISPFPAPPFPASQEVDGELKVSDREQGASCFSLATGWPSALEK